jgi:hypothetical protein
MQGGHAFEKCCWLSALSASLPSVRGRPFTPRDFPGIGISRDVGLPADTDADRSERRSPPQQNILSPADVSSNYPRSPPVPTTLVTFLKI